MVEPDLRRWTAPRDHTSSEPGRAPMLATMSEREQVAHLGLDRFDEDCRSRLASDPIALPFPVHANDEEIRPETSTAGR